MTKLHFEDPNLLHNVKHYAWTACGYPLDRTMVRGIESHTTVTCKSCIRTKSFKEATKREAPLYVVRHGIHSNK